MLPQHEGRVLEDGEKDTLSLRFLALFLSVASSSVAAGDGEGAGCGRGWPSSSAPLLTSLAIPILPPGVHARARSRDRLEAAASDGG